MNKVERKVIQWIEKNVLWLFIACITGISLYLRFLFRDMESVDFSGCLYVWFNQLKDGGGLRALNQNIGNYNTPYLTILALLTYLHKNPLYTIKLVSIIFDYVLAVGAGLLVYELAGKDRMKAGITYSVVILLPTVILNSSGWAQCDSIYAAFIVLSLWVLLKDKYNVSFLLFGLAFAFKLQAVFLLPLYIYLYFRKKEFSIFRLLVLGLIPNFVLSLPAAFFGRPLWSIIDTYSGQTEQNIGFLTRNMANIYAFMPDNGPLLGNIFMGFCIAGMGLVLLYMMMKNVRIDRQLLLTLALWIILWVIFLMPQMHDRYLYVGDVLAVVWVMVHRRKYYLPVCTVLISAVCYAPFLFTRNVINLQVPAAVYLTVLFLFTLELEKALQENAQKFDFIIE